MPPGHGVPPLQSSTQTESVPSVVGGGFVNEDCLHLTPLGELFDALGGKEVVTATLPDPADVTPQTFEGVLRDTLAGVIVETCDPIQPPA